MVSSTEMLAEWGWSLKMWWCVELCRRRFSSEGRRFPSGGKRFVETFWKHRFISTFDKYWNMPNITLLLRFLLLLLRLLRCYIYSGNISLPLRLLLLLLRLLLIVYN